MNTNMGKRVFVSFLFLFFFFLSGCSFWSSNMKIVGTITSEKWLKYEYIIVIRDVNENKYRVRFQLAVDGKEGYDPRVLKKLSLKGKRCMVEIGPHGVVLKAILMQESGNYEIPK